MTYRHYLRQKIITLDFGQQSYLIMTLNDEVCGKF